MKILRYIIPVTAGLLLLLSVGCDKLGGLKFTSSYSGDFVVLPGTGTDLSLFQKTVVCDLDSLLKANKISTDTLESVILKSAVIKTIDGKSTLKGVKSLKAYFIPKNLPEVLIAKMDVVPQDSIYVNLSTLSTELKPFMKLGKYDLLLKGTVDSKDTLKLNAKITYEFSTSSK